jgi:desulfoferrodoxin-like iron-binding protein
MTARKRNVVGAVYRCPVCGAEVSVVRDGAGALAPRCCNQPMERLAGRHKAYYCPVCGAEVMVIRPGAGALAPRCCNEPMVPRGIAA